jgi:hypothetical protein
VVALRAGILHALSTQHHAAVQTFGGDGLEVTGDLVKVGKHGEEVSDFGIETELNQSADVFSYKLHARYLRSLSLARLHFSLRENEVHVTTYLALVVVVLTSRRERVVVLVVRVENTLRIGRGFLHHAQGHFTAREVKAANVVVDGDTSG